MITKYLLRENLDAVLKLVDILCKGEYSKTWFLSALIHIPRKIEFAIYWLRVHYDWNVEFKLFDFSPLSEFCWMFKSKLGGQLSECFSYHLMPYLSALATFLQVWYIFIIVFSKSNSILSINYLAPLGISDNATLQVKFAVSELPAGNLSKPKWRNNIANLQGLLDAANGIDWASISQMTLVNDHWC